MPHSLLLLDWRGCAAAVRIGQEQGIRGIYKGHQATLLRIFPYAALNYMCYEQYKRVRRANEKQRRQRGAGLEPFVCAAAGVTREHVCVLTFALLCLFCVSPVVVSPAAVPSLPR